MMWRVVPPNVQDERRAATTAGQGERVNRRVRVDRMGRTSPAQVGSEVSHRISARMLLTLPPMIDELATELCREALASEARRHALTRRREMKSAVLRNHASAMVF